MKAKVKPKRELHVRWDITAERWLRRNGMPNGCALVLERLRDGRRVRGDTVIHRRRLPPRADDLDFLSDALTALQSVFITDIEGRNQRLKLYAPDGSALHGNKRISKIRALPGLPTEEDKTRAEQLEIEVDMLATSLRDDLDLAEDTTSSPEVVLRGYIRALRSKFTIREIAMAAEVERV